jgi:hypothetical protein
VRQVGQNHLSGYATNQANEIQSVVTRYNSSEKALWHLPNGCLRLETFPLRFVEP